MYTKYPPIPRKTTISKTIKIGTNPFCIFLLYQVCSKINYILLMAKKLKAKIDHIKNAVAEGRYRYTIHGAKQRIARRIKRHEIEEAVRLGEIIEDYPEHHYGPACLVFGKTEKGKVLHILFSLQEVVDLITVYEPDLIEWKEDLKQRRKK